MNNKVNKVFHATNLVVNTFKVATINVDAKALLCKIFEGDLIALGAHYHLSCLAKLYNKADRVRAEEDKESDKGTVLQSQCFEELIDYVESFCNTKNVLQMSELAQLYSDRLVSLGLETYTHTTRLRQSILSAIPDVTEILNNTNNRYELAFDEDINKAALEMSSRDCSSEVYILSQAAKILRKHNFEKKNEFMGTFSHYCQDKAVPPILHTFMHMLLDGPGIVKNVKPEKASVAVQSLSQLITFSSVKVRSNNPSSVPRHIRECETLNLPSNQALHHDKK